MEVKEIPSAKSETFCQTSITYAELKRYIGKVEEIGSLFTLLPVLKVATNSFKDMVRVSTFRPGDLNCAA